MIYRLETFLANPNRTVAALTLAALLLVGALVGGLYVAALGPMLALAFAIALIAGIVMLTSVEWGLYFLVLLIGVLPFAALPVKIVFTPTFLDLVLWTVFFVWIVEFATARKRDIRLPALGILVGVFIALAIFTFSMGLAHSRLTPTILRRFLGLMLSIALFFVVVDTMRDERAMRNLTRVIILGGFLTAFIGVLFYVIPQDWTVRVLNALARFHYPAGRGALRFIEDDPHNPMRAIGTAVDPNVLGGMMILAAGILAPQLASKKPVVPRWFAWLALATEFLCLFWTYSRGSMLGMLTALTILALVKYRRLLWVGALMVVGLWFLPWSKTYLQHLLAGFHGSDRATQMRFGEYRDAIRLISRYPWLGVGFINTPEIGSCIGVSCVYLLMAEEMGLVGLSVFLLAVIGFFAQVIDGWRRLRNNPEREAILLGVGGAVAGAMVGGIFDHYLFNLVYPHMAMLFWMYIGLGVAAASLKEEAA